LTDADLRPGEVTVALPAQVDAHLYFLGLIRTPWATRPACPKRGDRVDGPPCRIEIHPPWRSALAGLVEGADIEVLYWMHLARRDLVQQSPRASGTLFGTFALRSPMRPNPISSSVVSLLGIEADHLVVRGLDCVDGTPLVDLKPIRCPMWPVASDARAS
jgi:tRNA (adenine37-N6)-methyltransferase